MSKLHALATLAAVTLMVGTGPTFALGHSMQGGRGYAQPDQLPDQTAWCRQILAGHAGGPVDYCRELLGHS